MFFNINNMNQNWFTCTSNQFGAINSTKQRCSDIRLYIYDFVLQNYNMILPMPNAVRSPVFNVGLYSEAGIYMYLSPDNDNLLIQAQLIKKPATSIECLSFNEAVLILEILAADGNTLQYNLELPSRSIIFRNNYNLYFWNKEEKLSMLDRDTLHIRLKLSLRYPTVPSKNANMSDSSSIEILSNDIKKMLDNNTHFPDIAINVDGRNFLAHKAIVLNPLTHIVKLNSESNFKQEDSTLQSTNNNTGLETIFILNENAEVFLSILHFMYCGKIHVSNTLDDFSLYEFANRYRIHDLSMVLKPIEMHVQSQVNQLKFSFTWSIKDYSSFCGSSFNSCNCPAFQTGTDTMWNVTLFSFHSEAIFLNLQRIHGTNRDIQTIFKLKVCNIDGTPHDEREFKYFFKSNTTISGHPNFLAPESKFFITPNLLFNDTLIIGCDLIVSDGQLISDKKLISPSMDLNVSFTEWHNNLHYMLENKTHSDVILMVDENEFRVHKAILSARSPVFERMFQSDMTEKITGYVTIEDISSTAMKYTIHYMYTGMIGNLSKDYAIEVFQTADKYELCDLKHKCREFILNNLDAESACDVLILSFLHNDQQMKVAAENVICTKAAQILFSSRGQELMTNYPQLVYDILENLSAVFCSLPPQDVYERNHSHNQPEIQVLD